MRAPLSVQFSSFYAVFGEFWPNKNNSSKGRVPRRPLNPAEKLNEGYTGWERLI